MSRDMLALLDAAAHLIDLDGYHDLRMQKAYNAARGRLNFQRDRFVDAVLGEGLPSNHVMESVAAELARAEASVPYSDATFALVRTELEQALTRAMRRTPLQNRLIKLAPIAIAAAALLAYLWFTGFNR